MKRILLWILLVCFPLMGFTARVTSLYEADMPVASQTEDLKEQAIRDGFLQMLIKLTGDPNITKNRMIRESISKADYYVQEYSYSAVTMMSSEYTLHIRYNKVDVNKLLKQAGLAYWGETRPLLLVWLVVTDKQGNSDVIGSETPADIFSVMKREGKKFGLPVIFPLMDVDDVNQVSTESILNTNIPELVAASKRYLPDAMLIGVLQEKADSVESQWHLVLKDDQWNWSIVDKNNLAVIDAIMNEVSQTFAKHYVARAPEAAATWIKLTVSHVAEHDDFNDLIQYLKQLTPVQQVKLSQVTGDTVEVAVLIQGTVAAFQKNATIGQHLTLKSQDDETNTLVYEWVH